MKLLSAKVFHRDGNTTTAPFDHLALLVDDTWLADVGFGRDFRFPLTFDTRRPQHDPEGEFQLVDVAVDGDQTASDIDVLHDGKPTVRLERRPRELADFVPTCWWQQTSPDSHFTQSLTCSLPTATGRVTLSGHRLIRTEDDRRTERVLATDAEVLHAYAEIFGIKLSRLPVEPAT